MFFPTANRGPKNGTFCVHQPLPSHKTFTSCRPSYKAVSCRLRMHITQPTYDSSSKAIFLKSPIAYVSLEYMVFMKVYKSCILWFMNWLYPFDCDVHHDPHSEWDGLCIGFTMLYHIKNLPNLSFTFLIAPILARYPSLSFNIAIGQHHFLLGQSSVGGRGGYSTPHIQVRLRGPVIDVIEKFTLATRQLMN